MTCLSVCVTLLCKDTTPILQMKTLMLREIKQLAKATTYLLDRAGFWLVLTPIHFLLSVEV